MHRIRKGSDMLLRTLLQHRRLALLGLAIIILLIVLGDVLIPALVILLLGTIASFSTSYKRYVRIPPAVELVTFTTVIVSVAYGPVVGMFFGAIVTIIAEILTNALDIFIISFAPARAAIGFLAPFLFAQLDGNIVLAGIAASIIYNILAQPLYLLLADIEMRTKAVFFVFLNIGSNVTIFIILGPLLARLLGI